MGRKCNYTMESLSKKSKKVIEKHREPLVELAKIEARMMLEVALEEELTAFQGTEVVWS